MQVVSNKNVFMNIFDNVYELSQFLKKDRKPGRDNSSETSSFEFSGTHSYEEALDLMMYGDEETLKSVIEEKTNLKINGTLGNVANKQQQKNDICGVVPNVPLYVIGCPKTMINITKDAPSHKIVNIFLSMDCSARIEKEDILKAGAKYLSVIDILEKKGYRCNLYAGVTTEYSNNRYYLMVRVKTDREPLNIKKICFTIANPSFLRRIYFRWCEVFDFKEDITCGYGHPLDTKYAKKDLEKELKDNYITWLYQKDDTLTCDIQTVFERLKENGIDIEI